jgi:2-polyprenyl-3-methyl-5-hydroxy-6-metoxy-1,4-benzoquinol methylase
MTETHVFPWWMGYLLASPLRKLRDNPEAMLGPYLRPGMTVLDVGCAMGFFSLPMARMGGEEGRIICVDLQERMMRVLQKRARRAGLASRIETRICAPESLGLADLSGAVDFALVYAVLHEVPDRQRFLREIHQTLRRDGMLFFGEPPGPVPPEDYEEEVSLIGAVGFAGIPARHPERPMTAVFKKR